MERFLIDSNVILNLLFGIECHGEEAGKLWDWLKEKKENQEVEVYLTEKDLQDILFYVNKACDESETSKKLLHLTNFFKICEIDQGVLRKAHSYKNRNFEASVKVACQEIYGIDYLIVFQPTNYCISPYVHAITPKHIFTIYEDNIDLSKIQLEKTAILAHSKEHTNNTSLLTIQDYLITNFEVFCGNTQRHPKATIWLENLKNKKTIEPKNADGNGPVDAVYKAINQAIADLQIKIKDYILTQVYAVSVSKGTDAEVTVRVGVLCEGKEIRGFGTDTDLVKAAVYAYVSVLNKLLCLNPNSI